LERQRKAAEDSKVMLHYFRLFQKALTEHKVKKENIWNMNEKGFLMGMASRSKVVCRKGKRNPKYVHDGNRELISVLECLSATERVLPPLVVTKGKSIVAGHYIEGQEDPDWRFASSPKRWTNNELGQDWLEEVFQ
jgi:acetylornithine/succinyldiaminopimelate/putrescine aminotransferase